MSDAEKNGSATDDDISAQSDDDASSKQGGDGGSDREQSTLLGQGFDLPSPSSDDSSAPDTDVTTPDDEDNKVVPASLSNRLKKLAGKSTSTSKADDDPDVRPVDSPEQDGPTSSGEDEAIDTASGADDDDILSSLASSDTSTAATDDGDGPAHPDSGDDTSDDYGDEPAPTDRLDTLPFEVDADAVEDSVVSSDHKDDSSTTSSTSPEDEPPDPSDDSQPGAAPSDTPAGDENRSTMAMHSAVDASESSPTADVSSDEPDTDVDNFEVEATVLTDPAPLGTGDKTDPDKTAPDKTDPGAQPPEEVDEFEGEPTVLTDPGEADFDSGACTDSEVDTDDSGEFTGEKTQLSSPSFQRHDSGPPNSSEDSQQAQEFPVGEKTEVSPGLQGLPDADDPASDGSQDAGPGLVEDTDATAPPDPASPPADSSTSSRLQIQRPSSTGDTSDPVQKPRQSKQPTRPLEADSPPPDTDDKHAKDATQAPGGDTDSDGDSFEANDTELFDSPFENDPICARLTTLEGPAAGQDFFIDRNRNSIGRATDNAVAVPDMAMSRKHFEIVQHSDETYQIYDLKAVNGTSLNGVDIKEADLFHGDRIEAGQSLFQFVIPGDAPVQNRERHLIRAASSKTVTGEQPQVTTGEDIESPGPDRSTFDKVLLAITVVAGLLCIPLLGFLIHATVLDDSTQTDETQPASELYFEGVEALQGAQWERAEELFERSQQADPDFGEIDAQLLRIENERNSRAIIDSAREQTARGLDEEILDQLRSISPESHYYDDAQSLLSMAHQNEIRALFDRALDAYEDDDLDSAIGALEELSAVAPEHEQAQQLQRDIEEALTRRRDDSDDEQANSDPTPRPSPPSNATTSDADDTDSPLGNPFADRDDSEADGATGGIGHINFIDGFTLYRDEDFDEAIEHFQTIAAASDGAVGDRARRTADDIREFHDSLQRGQQARDDGDYQRAIESFRIARQADESVAGEGGSFRADVASHLASTLALQGRQYLEQEDYSAAYEQMERAEAHDESASEVQSLRQDLQNEAHSLYIRAANQRKSDPEGAAELIRSILTMIPPGHDTHQRAQELLEELD